MSGYFFLGSKCGGLTTQPWIFFPSSDESYQNSSTSPSAFAPSQPPFRAVSLRGLSCPGRRTATSAGRAGLVTVNASTPLAVENDPLAYGRPISVPPTDSASASTCP